MALKFTNTHEAARMNGVKVLVYGEPGVGKTVLCATAPNPIILSSESGLLSLRHTNIPVIQIDTVDDLTEAHQWFLKSKDARQFSTICIDSISEVAEVVLKNAKKQVKDARQAYMELLEKMIETVKAFRDLEGYNVYMSAKEELFKDEAMGSLKFRPMLPGSRLSPALPYLFDEVLALRIGTTTDKKTYRYLQTQPDMRYTAKDRSGSLAEIEQPDLTHVFTKIFEGAQ